MLYWLQKSSKAQHCQTPDLFDIIIFNFPHVGLGIKDQARRPIDKLLRPGLCTVSSLLIAAHV